MCEPPYIQVGHGTRLSKPVLSWENQESRIPNFMALKKKPGHLVSWTEFVRTAAEICKIHKTRTVLGKLGWMGSLSHTSRGWNRWVWSNIWKQDKTKELRENPTPVPQISTEVTQDLNLCLCDGKQASSNMSCSMASFQFHSILQ
jgi:hypothetical protein